MSLCNEFESLFSNFSNFMELLEHYEKAAKALGLDFDKIYMDWIKSTWIV
jgi:hypothetical protein